MNLIIVEIEKLEAQPRMEFADRPLSEITAYIFERYHQDLRRRLPELVTLSKKVEEVHQAHPACPHGLNVLLMQLHTELLFHMMKEENVLFPLIDAGRGSTALLPINAMVMEHNVHGENLEKLHQLTGDFRAPPDACPTWTALYAGLEKLEEELMEHIHLENNILFPRALAQTIN